MEKKWHVNSADKNGAYNILSVNLYNSKVKNMGPMEIDGVLDIIDGALNKRASDKISYNTILPAFAIPDIKNVIFNPPATIVFWENGTKTVVKAGENDIFDAEKGLAMAITKKALGNEGNYYNVIRKWVEAYEKEMRVMELMKLFLSNESAIGSDPDV